MIADSWQALGRSPARDRFSGHSTSRWIPVLAVSEATSAPLTTVLPVSGALIKAAIDQARARRLEGARNVGAAARLIATILLGPLLAAAGPLGMNVTARLPELGVRGVALGVQGTLAEVLGSLGPLFDTSLVSGDPLAIDPYTATIERIGLNMTRLCSPSGEPFMIGNSDTVKSRLRHDKRMRERALASTLRLTYENRYEALAHATALIEAIVQTSDSTERRACATLGRAFHGLPAPRADLRGGI